jgi:hypothetical protein
MPFPVFIENPISAVYPLALLDTFEINSSSIKVPKSVKCAYSERWRSAFRGDGDHDSELMAIAIPS